MNWENEEFDYMLSAAKVLSNVCKEHQYRLPSDFRRNWLFCESKIDLEKDDNMEGDL